MFKSVFAKYITAFMLIIVIGCTMLAAVTSSMLINYITESQQSLIDNAASTLDKFLTDQINKDKVADLSKYIEQNKALIQPSLKMFSQYASDLTIFITDEEGNILLTDGAHNKYYNGSKIPIEFIENAHKRYNTTTDFYGLFSEKYLACGIPLVASDENSTFLGTLYICSSSGELNALVQSMIKTIVIASLWIMLAALIAIYFITDRIIGPLKDIGKAAKSFASGKFDERVVVRGHDEIAELALTFNNMASSLAISENLRQTFLANLSHDLRTPMTSISGFVDGILDGTIPQEKQEYYLQLVSKETKRLSRLVTTLLDLSRIQAGERKFNMTTFDICEMGRLILISLEQRISDKQLDVEFDCEKDNMYVTADKDAIYQVLYNICDNAVKFSKSGGKYRIKIVGIEKKIYVSVYNEGQGIKEDELPYVFDRFYKSDKSRSLDKTGAGLGLYISKTIMDAHSEEIWVKSTYGEYCEFIFTLQKANAIQIKKLLDKSDSTQSKDI